MSAVVLRGDAAHLPLPDGSVDAIVCDPPYALPGGFMGKTWDRYDGREDAGFAYWLTGLIDGEGHFGIKAQRGADSTHVPFFALKLRADERPTLEAIRRELGIGQIQDEPKEPNPLCRWAVQTKPDCQRLVDVIDKYGLRAKKRMDYAIWRQAVCEWTSRPRGNRWHGPTDDSRMIEFKHRMETVRKFADPPWSGHEFQDWCRIWARECLRVLKPGGHLLAFGGTRTWHRMVCAIEDAGFEIRDGIADLTGQDAPGLIWNYGAGFPKSLDVSKAIDKAGGNPLAFREFARAYAAAVAASELTHADIDRHLGIKASSCFWSREDHRGGMPPRHHWSRVRDLLALPAEFETIYEAAEREVIGTRRAIPGVAFTTTGPTELDVTIPATEQAVRWDGWGTALKPGWEPIAVGRKPLAGTVAQNVLQHGTGALNVDGCRVDNPGPHGTRGRKKFTGFEDKHDVYGDGLNRKAPENPEGRWPPNIVLGSAAAEQLDRQSGTLISGANPARRGSDKFRDAYGDFAGQQECTVHRGVDSGGASRFFPVFRYEAKADAASRPRLPDGTAWPTVKPVALMQWLVRLVTPPGGRVLDLFCGTGTTGEACAVEGFDCILIDRDPQAIALTKVRLARMVQPGLFRPEDSAPAAPVRPVAAARSKPAPVHMDTLFDEAS